MVSAVPEGVGRGAGRVRAGGVGEGPRKRGFSRFSPELSFLGFPLRVVRSFRHDLFNLLVRKIHVGVLALHVGSGQLSSSSSLSPSRYSPQKQSSARFIGSLLPSSLSSDSLCALASF